MSKTEINTDGAIPAQIRALNARIARDACSIHPYHKWVYVGGTVVRINLNRIFGFDGWRLEILDMKPIAADMGDPVTQVKGKRGPMFVAIMQCRVRLHVKWPGGRESFHDGIGTSGVEQKKRADAIGMNSQSAVTYALRDAAINLGGQFGLHVMRLKVNDAQGNQIPWQEFTAQSDPEWPDWESIANGVEASGGNQTTVNYNTIVPDDCGDDEPQRQIEPHGTTDVHPTPVQPTKSPWEKSRVEGLPSDLKREAMTGQLSKSFGATRGAKRAELAALLESVASAHDWQFVLKNMRKSASEGGPTDHMLFDMLKAIGQ